MRISTGLGIQSSVNTAIITINHAEFRSHYERALSSHLSVSSLHAHFLRTRNANPVCPSCESFGVTGMLVSRAEWQVQLQKGSEARQAVRTLSQGNRVHGKLLRRQGTRTMSKC